MFLDSQSYNRLMEMAFREAERAYEKNEVPVGAVIFDSNGAVVGRGFNQVEMLGDTTAHAEMLALTSAMNALGDKYLTDCTLVVTMEPCPMCAGAMINAKLGRLIFGSYDAKMGAAGTVFNLTDSKLLNHQIEVVGGILEERTTEILKRFFAQKRAKLGQRF